MPTYDYVCLACDHALEIEHSISAPARKKCPKCGKSQLERRISGGAGFVFKGSGFYKTDYRAKPAEDEAPAKTETRDASADAPGAAKSDTTKSGAAKSDATTSKAGALKAETPSAPSSGAESKSAKRDAPAADKSAAKPSSSNSSAAQNAPSKNSPRNDKR